MDGVTSGALQECGDVISGVGGLSWRKQPVLPRWERPQGESTATGLGVQAPGARGRKFSPGSRVGNAIRTCLNPSVLIFLVCKTGMTILTGFDPQGCSFLF